MPTLSIKTWFSIAGACLAAVVVWFAYKKVHDHFAHIKDIEAQNTKLTETNTRLNTRVTELANINQDNKKVYEDKLAQAKQAQRLAEEERQAAEKRALKYRNIRDAAKNTPPADRRPVGPAVQSTVDRLWN